MSWRKEETGRAKQKERIESREGRKVCFNRNPLSFCPGPAINLTWPECLIVVMLLACVLYGYCIIYDHCDDASNGM